MSAIAEISNILVPEISTICCAHCCKVRNAADCKTVYKDEYSSLKGKFVQVRLTVCNGVCSQLYESNARIRAAKRNLASRSNPFNRRGMQW